jgi:ABC-2 type transport system ATP-binding protein
MAAAIEVVGLVKRYGSRTALHGLTLAVEAGAITAILGPNGAGKTTLIETCEGFRRQDAGTVRVLGLDPHRQARQLKPRIGVMLQQGGIYPAARPRELLNLLASFYARPLLPDLLIRRLGLEDATRTPVRRLSGGQQQRLALAAALIGRPELLFLDEPTTGLDPQARQATWELIQELRGDGVTVVLTTHYMEEAERLADTVVIVDHGRLLAQAPPRELVGPAPAWLEFQAQPGLDLAGLQSRLPDGVHVREASPGRYRAEGTATPQVIAVVAGWCAEQGVLAGELRVASRSLEDVFLELTGRAPSQ